MKTITARRENTPFLRCIIFACFGLISLFGQSVPLDNPARVNVFRDVETKLEVIPTSKTIRVIITNRANETRYVMFPPDLMPYRIKLTTADGHALAMTPQGQKKLTRPAGGGSMRGISLETGVPWSHSIDLEPLFQFPEQGEVRCEVSRHIFFTHPDIRPADKEWLPFPPVMLPSGKPAPEPKSQAGASSPPATQPAATSGDDAGTAEPSPTKPKATAPTVTIMPTSMEATASTPWSVVAMIVAAAIGLLWLVLKKRK
ncbi:hypothetical protein [Prosthecobacter sp.]|uniref:hypothetical protein n=1 Tax=Prosthecobacter sp. TaxID=1965333 RepID=UPI002AB7F486|nr:hypothetical protein [Prosthecobacter sp.]MDZ4404916.1 hypothetical protein [Prosthecobacter sp.]